MQFENIKFYKCFYCSKTYKIKENYKNHITDCELYHKIMSSTEKMPTHKEMFYLIKSLAFKCNKLETELHQLKNVVSIRKKKEILYWLNTEKKGEQAFTDFYNGIKIEEEDLKVVLEYDLLKGVEHIVIKALKNVKDIRPIFCCNQKTNQIYIYDYWTVEQENQEGETEKRKLQWKIGGNGEIEKMVITLNNKFLEEYIVWKQENKDMFRNTEESINLEMSYMSKLIGYKLSIEKMVLDIKKKIYKEFQENLSENYE